MAELPSKNFYIVAVGEYFRLVVLVVPEAQHLSRRSENINIGQMVESCERLRNHLWGLAHFKGGEAPLVQRPHFRYNVE